MVENEKIKEAVKKCNPQAAVYALADLVDDYQGAIDRAQTTADQAQQTAEQAQEAADTALTNANAAKTESAAANAAATKAEADAANALTTANSAAADASEAAENALNAKTQAGEALRASGTATTTANEALSVAQAADTLAGKAQNRANEAYAYAGDVDNKVIQTNVDLNNLKTATNSALIGITAPTNTSTVTLDLERIVGTDNVPLPVASATQAGVLNANDYKQLQDYAGRIGALEGSLAIYPVTLPSDNPSSEQITNAYTSQYPDAPNPPLDNTTVSDVQRKITYRYTSIGNTWIQVSYEVTQQFTNSSPGTIKGSTSAGMISANADGTGSLNGYDALNSGVAGSLSGITAEGTATAINLITTKNNGTQTVVTLPQASNTQGGTISAVDYQKLQNSGVPIFTNDVLGAIKGSTEDGKISANEDGTGSLNGYTELKSKTDLIGTSTIQSPLQIQTNPQNVTIAWTEGGSGLRSSCQIPSVSGQSAGVLSVSQARRFDNSIKEISVSQQPTEIEINVTRNNGTTDTSATITPVSDTQAGVMTPEMLAKLNKGVGYSIIEEQVGTSPFTIYISYGPNNLSAATITQSSINDVNKITASSSAALLVESSVGGYSQLIKAIAPNQSIEADRMTTDNKAAKIIDIYILSYEVVAPENLLWPVQILMYFANANRDSGVIFIRVPPGVTVTVEKSANQDGGRPSA